MKRITFIILTFFLAQTAIAQNEIAIEQTLDQPIGCLYIWKGWDVRLMHRETDGYRIAVVVPERYAAIADETPICNLSGDTLTLLENTALPQGTVVELEGNLNFRAIEIFKEAKVSIDRLYMPQNAELHSYLYLMKKAEVSINQLVFSGESWISLSDGSKLSIDTIQGSGNPEIELYDADYQYGTNLLNGEILVKEYKRPTRFYEKKNPKVIRTEIIDGQPVTKERYKIWDNVIAVDVGIGFRKHQNPVDFSSPFTNNGVLSFSWGLTTSFRFSDHWTLTTGLRLNTNTYYMAHQLKLTENGMESIDGQTPIQINRLSNDYLGVPVSLYWNFSELLKSSLSFDVFFGHIIDGSLMARTAEDNYKKWHIEDASNLFNPWKLEIGLSFNTNQIGFIHGFRVYTNLLPEYSKAATTEKFRSIGFEVRF